MVTSWKALQKQNGRFSGLQSFQVVIKTVIFHDLAGYKGMSFDLSLWNVHGMWKCLEVCGNGPSGLCL